MHVRKLLRIARWEVSRNAVGVDRRTLGLLGAGGVAVLLLAGVAVAGSVGVDAGIYRIGVDESSPYYGPAATDPMFDVRPAPDGGSGEGLELVVIREYVGPVENTTAKSRAAQAEFRTTVADYNDALMAREDNATAAFPVSVTLTYAEQESVAGRVVDGETGPGGETEPGGEPGDGEGDGTGTGTGNGDDGDDGSTGDDVRAPRDGVGGIGGSLTGGDTTGTPSDIAPPFPFESLVLAFLYLVPMNFVIQAYGSTMLSERLNRRGELLLVSPVTRADVIAGKTLPYLAGAVGVVTAITMALRFGGFADGGSHVAVLAVLPLVLLFLGATFCGAMFARSFKELTFVTVTVTVSLTSYAFVPAIFTDVTPIALISPLTIVVRDLQGEAIDLGSFLFSTTPPTLSALVLFGLGAGLYREEDMFTQRAIPLKVLDALAGQISSRWSALKLSALLLPFVFVAELIAVALLFLLDQLGIVLVLLAVVAVEEPAKSLHLYAGYEHGRYDRSLRTAVIVGTLSGVGFFAAEKFVAIAQVVGLDTVEAGQAAFVTGLPPGGVPLAIVVVLLLLAPLALHVVTAVISSLGARRGRRSYAIALTVAMAVHFAYNYTVVTILGI